MEKLVKTFEKNKFQEIRVSITQYQGNDLIDMRIWATDQSGRDKVPTAKGVSMNVKLFEHLKEAVALLEKELKDNNLL
jgi:fumarate hydratase class II